MILAKNSRASWATQNSSLLACWLACSAKTLRLLICLLFLALYSWTFCTLVMKAPWVKVKGLNKCPTFPKLPGRSDLIFTLIINSLFSFFSLILLGRPGASRQYNFYGLPTVFPGPLPRGLPSTLAQMSILSSTVHSCLQTFAQPAATWNIVHFRGRGM